MLSDITEILFRFKATISLTFIGSCMLIGMDHFLPYWLGLPLEGLMMAALVELWWHRYDYEAVVSNVELLTHRAAQRLEDSELVQGLIAERDQLLSKLRGALHELESMAEENRRMGVDYAVMARDYWARVDAEQAKRHRKGSKRNGGSGPLQREEDGALEPGIGGSSAELESAAPTTLTRATRAASTVWRNFSKKNK